MNSLYQTKKRDFLKWWYLYSDLVCARSTSHFEWHNLQSLDKALDLFIEFKFCESIFTFWTGANIVWWLLITSVQCIGIFNTKSVLKSSGVSLSELSNIYNTLTFYLRCLFPNTLNDTLHQIQWLSFTFVYQQNAHKWCLKLTNRITSFDFKRTCFFSRNVFFWAVIFNSQ